MANISIILATPAWPPSARPQNTGRPTNTAEAPSASARTTSRPRRTPDDSTSTEGGEFSPSSRSPSATHDPQIADDRATLITLSFANQLLHAECYEEAAMPCTQTNLGSMPGSDHSPPSMYTSHVGLMVAFTAATTSSKASCIPSNTRRARTHDGLRTWTQVGYTQAMGKAQRKDVSRTAAPSVPSSCRPPWLLQIIPATPGQLAAAFASSPVIIPLTMIFMSL